MYATPLVDYIDQHDIDQYAIRHVAVLGSDTLGRQAGLLAAMNGYDVFLFDEHRKALNRCVAAFSNDVERLVGTGCIADARTVLNNIFPTTHAHMAARNADLVIDALPGYPETKADVLAEFDALCRDHTVFMTTTAIPFSPELAEQTGRPGRLVSVRFYPPVWNNTVLDIMPHTETTDETIAIVTGFARAIGLTPQLRPRTGWRKKGQVLTMASGQA